MNQFITKHATGKKVLLFVIISGIIYALMALVTVPNLLAHSNGWKILDMMSKGYDFEYVKDLFEKLGVEGRNAYLYQQIPLDLIFPLLYGPGSFLLMVYLFKKIDVKNAKVYYLCLVPVVGAVFDYFENFGTIRLLNNYPDISSSFVQMNSFFTILKSGFITLFFIILIITFLVFLFKKVKALRAAT